jgi:hypothetical protein
MINFNICNMWQQRSQLLAPLTEFTSNILTLNWDKTHQTNFDAIKRIIGCEVSLAYLDSNAPFHVHIDTSKLRIGAIISQNGKPIAFYSKKMNSAHGNYYTTMVKELLSIVETLKEFRNMLLGHQVIDHTDHKNLTFKNFNIECIM